jgi:carboxyl-terminal processing protease
MAAGEKKDGMHLREKDLDNHFEGEGKDKSDEKTEKLPNYKTDEQVKSDYQILRALDLLKGWEILKKVMNSTP